MKYLLFYMLYCLPFLAYSANDGERTVINLNGTWQFDQTLNAFPPVKFTRTISVPGLIHLAEPKIEDYDKFLKRNDNVEAKDRRQMNDPDYTPKYSWYRKSIFISKDLESKEGMITIKKSQYVTQVYVNGMDMGVSMACYTPVEFLITKALKFGVENEILIKVGDRIWLPSEAAGGTDTEKDHYIPGIWDDVLLSFTGKLRVNRLLVLPSVANKKITIKAQIRSLFPAQNYHDNANSDSTTWDISIVEKKTGKVVTSISRRFSAKRDNLSEVIMDIPMKDFTNWSPDNPFLYLAKATLKTDKGISDEAVKQFGMRDFTRKGKFFYLNGEKIILRGTNVTLQRFFEDPDCGNLVWDKEWVKKLLVDYPKGLNWNMMRICVGIAPDFWYDIADENGLMFQNEWLYWSNHGWDEQIRKEYTDWVWTDGNHPSITIWDAINENWDNFIGNTLIPDLKKLDPTRVWDAGYMSGDQMTQDEMDEPHPYQGVIYWLPPGANRDIYPLGNLDFNPSIMQEIKNASSAQLVNEYGWIWLWRNGLPSKLTVEVYEHYLGKNSTPDQNWELQAYWMQLETEWLRSESNIAGVLAFCYLANNYGYTGDWFAGNIRDLKPSLTLDWFQHAFAPVATFINLTDERYVRMTKAHDPGSNLLFNLAGINNQNQPSNGSVKLSLLDSKGKSVTQQNFRVKLESFVRTDIPVSVVLPSEAGGYLLVAEFTAENGSPVISRRFIKVGDLAEYSFYNLNPNTK
ncbi:MAG: hypothetical protein K0M40_21395 [Prolixibacteraceae bacterium]|nr:hypothetical protein [Prolixibacteraceae bacterium]